MSGEPTRAEPLTRTFGPCGKCSGDDILVRFHDGAEHCRECRSIASCRHSEETCGPFGRRGEHLVVTCRRCQHAWVEEPSDAVRGDEP